MVSLSSYGKTEVTRTKVYLFAFQIPTFLEGLTRKVPNSTHVLELTSQKDGH